MTSFTIILARALRLGMVWVVAAGLLSGLGGCASGPNANPRDPFEPFNRHVMQFNEGLDAVALKPAATVYKTVLPPLVRTGVNNFFSNLGDAWSFVNSVLQLKFHNAGENILRFNFNTFFGFGGILDIASELNIERHKEDFGQTLGRWGVPAGPYLVLPFFGPSTVRDALALPLDSKGNPLHYVDPWETRYSLYVLGAVDTRSNLLRASSVLDEAALDKYSFTRDAHLQRRRAAIFENKTSDTEGREPKADGEPAESAGQVPPLEPPGAPPTGSGTTAPETKP
jgi:phospholipid-binding lipoprotein MlaA